MGEWYTFSWLLGGLGLQSLAIGSLIYRHQWYLTRLEKEEEEALTRYESREMPSSPTANPGHSVAHPAASQLYNTFGSSTSDPTAKDPRLAGWEFKIVRANLDLFRDPRVLRALCQEEAEAGWIMLEKLDDRRIRFKRPLALREVLNPQYLKHDPYRTQYGPSWPWLPWLGTAAALVAIFLPAYLGYALVSTVMHRQPPTEQPAEAPAAPATPTAPR